MKNSNTFPIVVIPLFLVLLIVVLLSGPAQGEYLKTNNPPDVDKVSHQHGNTSSCWVVAAADMLAGAGYGDGSTPQQRADDIYLEMCNDPNIDHNVVSCCRGCYGWADTALREWLRSPCNKWKQTNPYKIVTVHGPPNWKNNRAPWQKTDLPMFIGNELRKCNMVRLSILPASGASYGHEITAWGDEGGAGSLTENPSKIKVTDSDFLFGITGNVQTYTYDDYNAPNPGGTNNGVGWYFNYNYSEDNHRYIDSIVTLSVTSYDMNTVILGGSKKFLGSYKIHQDSNDANALALHYKVLSGSILSYRTTIDWDNNDVSPSIVEDNSPPDELNVNWNLSDNPVPFCNDVTITTELVLPWTWGTGIFNPISYDDVNFVYLGFDVLKPSFGWRMTSPLLSDPLDANATGGYVIGAFDIFENPTGPVIAEYRFMYEYGYDQNSQSHEFELIAPPQSYAVGNFRFGHSYAFLDDQALWQFTGPWLTIAYDTPSYPQLGPAPPFDNPIVLDWAGQLPYPNPNNYTPGEPNECGDYGTYYLAGDINKDCRVTFEDFAEFCLTWLQCTDPEDSNCL
jgi:hypothetical protein